MAVSKVLTDKNSQKSRGFNDALKEVEEKSMEDRGSDNEAMPIKRSIIMKPKALYLGEGAPVFVSRL